NLKTLRHSSKHPSLLGFTSALRGAIQPCLTAFFKLRGHQADCRDARSMHDINYSGHRLKFDNCVAANKSRMVCASPEYLLELAVQGFPRDRLLINLQRAISRNLNNNNIRLWRRGGRIRLLRDVRLQPHLRMLNDHEYDQQHQQNVNQRNDVDCNEGSTFRSINCDSHEPPRTKLPPREEDSHIPQLSIGRLPASR